MCKNNAILQYHITAMINKHWWEHCQRLSSRLSYKTDARPHWHSPDSANQHPTAGFLQCDHASPICALAHYYLRAQSGSGGRIMMKSGASASRASGCCDYIYKSLYLGRLTTDSHIRPSEMRNVHRISSLHFSLKVIICWKFKWDKKTVPYVYVFSKALQISLL